MADQIENDSETPIDPWVMAKFLDNPSIFWAAGYERHEAQHDRTSPFWNDTEEDHLKRFWPLLGHLIDAEKGNEFIDHKHAIVLELLSSAENTAMVLDRTIDFELALSRAVNRLNRALVRREPPNRLLTDDQASRIATMVDDAEHFRDWELPPAKNLFADALAVDRAIRRGDGVPVESWLRLKQQMRGRGPGRKPKYMVKYFILAMASLFEEFNEFNEVARVKLRRSRAKASKEHFGTYESAFLDFLKDAREVVQPNISNLVGQNLDAHARSILQNRRDSGLTFVAKEICDPSAYELPTLIALLERVKY